MHACIYQTRLRVNMERIIWRIFAWKYNTHCVYGVTLFFKGHSLRSLKNFALFSGYQWTLPSLVSLLLCLIKVYIKCYQGMLYLTEETRKLLFQLLTSLSMTDVI